MVRHTGQFPGTFLSKVLGIHDGETDACAVAHSRTASSTSAFFCLSQIVVIVGCFGLLASAKELMSPFVAMISVRFFVISVLREIF